MRCASWMTGTAVYSSCSSSVSLRRSPWVGRPVARTVAISGRLAYDAPGAGPAESASSTPPRSTTMTRPPTSSDARVTRLPSSAGLSRLSDTLAATRCASPAACAFTSASTRRERLSESGSSSATSTRTSTYAKAASRRSRRLMRPHAGDLVAGGEPEPDAPRGVDVRGIGRIVAELLAEAAHVDVERLRRPEPGRVPHLLDDPLAREDRACIRHEQPKQVELLATELERLAALRHRAARRVEPYRRRSRSASSAPAAGSLPSVRLRTARMRATTSRALKGLTT